MTRTTLEQYRQADIYSCDLAELVDLRTIHIDPNLSVPERTRQFLDQVRNPYLFRVDDLIVKVRYEGDRPFLTALAALC